jgi:hypothetical protein
LRNKIALAAIVGLIVVSIAALSMNSKKEKPELLIWDSQDPYSADPYLYDLHIHHVVFGSVFSKLFSNYADSKLSGSLAASWESSSSYTEWKFKIRSDVKFSNGDAVTADDVARSLKRFWFLSKKNKSDLLLIKAVKGLDSLTALDQPCEGISAQGDTVTLKLNVGDPDLYDTFAFGNYAIVHKNDHDPKTGEWTAKVPISSGPYAVEEFDLEKKLARLVLREDFPSDLRAENAFPKVTISWRTDDRKKADLLEAYDGEASPSASHRFLRKKGTDLIYIQFYPWQNRDNIFWNVETRKEFREKFYKVAKEMGFETVRSFFPLIFPGVSELPAPASVDSKKFLSGMELSIRPPRNLQAPRLKRLKEVLIATIEQHGGTVKLAENMKGEDFLRLNSVKPGDKVEVDVAVLGTSMGAADPTITVKQMFSKEGINIPDPTRRARAIIEKDVSLTKLNEVIFDDAIVMPVYHYSNGIWANERLDFSRYNTMMAISELQWIGQK